MNERGERADCRLRSSTRQTGKAREHGVRLLEPGDAPPPGCAAGRLASYGPLVDAVVANTSVRLARLPLLARTWNGLKPGLDPPLAKSRAA